MVLVAGVVRGVLICRGSEKERTSSMSRRESGLVGRGEAQCTIARLSLGFVLWRVFGKGDLGLAIYPDLELF